MRLGRMLVALVLALLAACDDGGGDEIVCRGKALCDASPQPDAIRGCDPVADVACPDGQKCTWIEVDAATGYLGCAADGDVVEGAACRRGPAGESTGYDDCAGGLYCVDGTCRPFCTVTPDTCAAPATCVARPDLFPTTPAPLGLCEAP